MQSVSCRTSRQRNQVMRSCIGMGYHDTIVPPVIQRNVLESPGWYTQYTPYQAEISQGRLEALLNYQTMISDLTRLPIANASLLDEGTAAAEAMLMCRSITSMSEGVFFVDENCHPQTHRGPAGTCSSAGHRAGRRRPGHVRSLRAVLLRGAAAVSGYPWAAFMDHAGSLIERVHDHGGLVVMAADLLSLVLIKAPGDLGADIASDPLSDSASPWATGDRMPPTWRLKEAHVRKMPGRLIGVSVDATGAPALRMSIQTREQHIKRDRATSNICTAQVLLAIMSGFYAVYHGPDGLRPHRHPRALPTPRHSLRACVDSVSRCGDHAVLRHPDGRGRCIEGRCVHASRRSRAGSTSARFDGEDADRRQPRRDRRHPDDVRDVLAAFNDGDSEIDFDPFVGRRECATDDTARVESHRRSGFLEHEVFNTHHSETEMLRYITWLQGRDLSLAQSMIPLGSCTMKLNGTTEMLGVTWPEFGNIHPFAPLDQAEGYLELMRQLEEWLADLTGFDAVSLQPNAGSQGEYAGLRRDPCLPREAGRLPAERLPHPGLGPRHQSGQRRDGGDTRSCPSAATAATSISRICAPR